MKREYIMHIRHKLYPGWQFFSGRAVTVIATVDDESPMWSFQLAVKSPGDNYCKKMGVAVARRSISYKSPLIKPKNNDNLKMAVLNSLGYMLEHSSLTFVQERDKATLAFKTIADIALNNDWFTKENMKNHPFVSSAVLSHYFE